MSENQVNSPVQAEEEPAQDINILKKDRMDKLADLKELGKDPFQITKFDVTGHAADYKKEFEAKEAEILAAVGDDEEKKAAISALVEWITLDCTEDGLLYAWANGLLNENGTKDTVSSGTVMKMSDGSMGILDGQNPFEIFVDATKYASAKCKCEYDSTFNGAFKDQAKAYANGEKSRDEAINEFKNKVYEAGVEI